MDTRQQLQQLRDTIKNQCRTILMQYETGSETVLVTNDTFLSISPNVYTKVCSLDSNDMTVVNVVFEEGGNLPVHSHDRIETIYVISGSITDLVTNKTYTKGSVYVIPPHVKHHIVSDYARLTVTWVPAYPGGRIEVE